MLINKKSFKLSISFISKLHRKSQKAALCLCFQIITALITASSLLNPSIAKSTETSDNKNAPLPISDFMKKPKISQIKLDSSGKYLSYRYESYGKANIYIAHLSSETIKSIKAGNVVGNKITTHNDISIKSYKWSGESIIYTTDKSGDENTNLYFIENAKNNKEPIVHTIGDKKNVKYTVIHSNCKYVFFMSNEDNKHMMDVYIWNKKTKKKHKIFHNTQGFYNFYIDSCLNCIILEKSNSNTSKIEYWKYNLKPILKHISNEKFNDNILIQNTVIKSSKNLRKLYINGNILFYSNNYVYSYLDTANNGFIIKKHINHCSQSNNKSLKILFRQKNKKSTIDSIIYSHNKICAVRTYFTQEKWHTRGIIKNLQCIIQQYATQNNLVNVEWQLTSNDDNYRHCICIISASNKQPESYLIDMKSESGPRQKNNKKHKSNYTNNIDNKNSKHNKHINQITQIFEKNYHFQKTEAILIKARDGLQILCYLTKPEKNMSISGQFPLIVLVHGGPACRDYMTFCRLTQFLVSRGYAVLKVNYRGSDGLGETFCKSGNGEWAEKSYYDVLDSVKYLQSQSWVKKVCIMGGSYGGYQTLIGCWKNPEIFSCGIDICGPSDIKTLIQSIPPYWKGLKAHLWKIILNPSIIEDDQTMFKRHHHEIDKKSPLNKKIYTPLLIVQGKNDPRVNEKHSRQMYKNLIKLNKNSTKTNPLFMYLMFKNEGHSIMHQENLQYLMIIIELFLSKTFTFEKNIFEFPKHIKPKDAILKKSRIH